MNGLEETAGDSGAGRLVWVLAAPAEYGAYQLVRA